MCTAAGCFCFYFCCGSCNEALIGCRVPCVILVVVVVVVDDDDVVVSVVVSLYFLLGVAARFPYPLYQKVQ